MSTRPRPSESQEGSTSDLSSSRPLRCWHRHLSLCTPNCV